MILIHREIGPMKSNCITSKFSEITSNCRNVSNKLERSSQRTLTCPLISENSESIICSQSLTSTSLIPSSSKRFLSLAVDKDISSDIREKLSFNDLSEKRLLVETKAFIHASLSFFVCVLR